MKLCEQMAVLQKFPGLGKSRVGVGGGGKG